MSYEKLSRISTFKDGKITITSACNNLRPIRYETWEFKKLDGETQKDAVTRIAKDIIDGNFHPNRSCNLDLYNAQICEKLVVSKACSSLSKLDHMMMQDYATLRDTYYKFYEERKNITAEVIAEHILKKGKKFTEDIFYSVISKLNDLDSKINNFIINYKA